jgi:hypothetical protein
VAGCGECGVEPSGFCATELVNFSDGRLYSYFAFMKYTGPYKFPFSEVGMKKCMNVCDSCIMQKNDMKYLRLDSVKRYLNNLKGSNQQMIRCRYKCIMYRFEWKAN